MERIYSGIRSMKHDMKNTLAVIMQLAGKEEAELQMYGLYSLNDINGFNLMQNLHLYP